MGPIDILIIILAVLTVGGVVVYTIWKKKNGKGGCGCGCRGCPSAGSCSLASNCPSAKNNTSAEEKQEEKENA